MKHQIVQFMSHKTVRWLAYALFLLMPGSLLLLPLIAVVRFRVNKGDLV